MALIVQRLAGYDSSDIVPLDRFSEEQLHEHIDSWFEAYGYGGWQEARQKLIEDKIEAEEYLQAQGRWFGAIESVTGSLWREVAEPVFAALQSLKADQVFLIPTGCLPSCLCMPPGMRRVEGESTSWICCPYPTSPRPVHWPMRDELPVQPRRRSSWP